MFSSVSEEPTRTFVSHLLLSLFKEKFKTFKCDEEIPPDQPASSQMLEAIKEFRIAILFISKNYTATVSFLDELAMVIECKEKQSLIRCWCYQSYTKWILRIYVIR